jgi:UDP-glucose 4-epimerase
MPSHGPGHESERERSISKSIFITGAFGFLGRHLAKAFAAAGWDVVGLGHCAIPAEEARRWGIARAVTGDVTADLLRAAAERAGPPEAIFHAAGAASVGESWADPERDHARTVTSTEEVIKATIGFAGPPPILYPSSAAVYGDSHAAPIPEDTPLEPISPYGRNKVSAENLLRAANREHGIGCGIIRYFSLFGEGLRKQILWDISRRALAGEAPLTLSGTGHELRDFMYAEDAARLALHVLDGVGRDCLIVNGGSGGATSVKELAGTLLSALSIDAQVVFTGAVRKGDPFALVADVSRLEALGFAPVWDLEKALDDYARWILGELGTSESGSLERA